MGLDEYLAKHYGAVPGKKRKDKKKSKKKQDALPSSYGINVIIKDDADDDSTSGRQVVRSEPSEATAPAAAKPAKEKSGSWRTIRPSKTDHIDHILGDDDDDDDERPAIAEGAELIQEYQAQRRREEEEQQARRRELLRQKRAQQEEAGAARSLPGRQSRSPSPTPMRYGLQTAAAVKEDSDRARERYMRKLRESTTDVSGRGAETVHRDAKTGKIVDMGEVRRQEHEQAQQREALRRQHSEWNKGLVQQREKHREAQAIESMRQSGEAPDHSKELEAERRARQHWNDPALKFLQAKKHPKATYPEYQGSAPPNRFGIRPGYRWDGVDRSNGFEKDVLASQASAAARQAESYSNAVAGW
ncbi:Pre-mRNA-splicing factor cwc26 [Coemansia sp. RSA 552]|nr:Pre-mRNA-splicing factor cwc26 [Coemansia sp. RSA 552]